MRVLFFNYEYPPLGGGGANANAYLFKEFARQKALQIDCVTSAVGTSDSCEEIAGNITLHRLAVGKKQLHYWTQPEVFRYLVRAQRLAGRLCKENSYDVCHAFFGFPSGLLAWLRRSKTPYLVSLRGSDVPGFNPRLSLQYKILSPLFKSIWRNAWSTVANSVGLRELAQQTTPQLNIDVIPNGIDTEQFSPVSVSEQVPGRILCVSRLVGRKGVQHLIEAMPIVLSHMPEAKLHLIGEGDLLSELKSRCVQLGIADSVVFEGYVSHDDLPTHYREAVVYVQPSYYEGMSNTILEAMACGLPIVATGEGGKEELLRGNANTTPYADPEALAKAIVDLLQDKDRRLAMGKESREMAEGFSWRSVADRYLGMYQTMIDKPSPRTSKV